LKTAIEMGTLQAVFFFHRRHSDMMHDVVRRLEDGSLRANISQTIPFNMAIGVLNSLDRYSCGKTVVVMDTDFQPQLSL